MTTSDSYLPQAPFALAGGPTALKLGKDEELWLVQLPPKYDSSRPSSWKVSAEPGGSFLARTERGGASYRMVGEAAPGGAQAVCVVSGGGGRAAERIARTARVFRATGSRELCFGDADVVADPGGSAARVLGIGGAREEALGEAAVATALHELPADSDPSSDDESSDDDGEDEVGDNAGPRSGRDPWAEEVDEGTDQEEIDEGETAAFRALVTGEGGGSGSGPEAGGERGGKGESGGKAAGRGPPKEDGRKDRSSRKEPRDRSSKKPDKELKDRSSRKPDKESKDRSSKEHNKESKDRSSRKHDKESKGRSSKKHDKERRSEKEGKVRVAEDGSKERHRSKRPGGGVERSSKKKKE